MMREPASGTGRRAQAADNGHEQHGKGPLAVCDAAALSNETRRGECGRVAFGREAGSPAAGEAEFKS
ncbi:unnamed protein product [Lampetra planeri]